jgi:hypothetical protein
MFFMVSVRAATTVLVGAELDDLAERVRRDRLRFPHLFGALVERVLAFGREQRRSLTGKACALRRQLQAGCEARDVPSAEVLHGPAELPEHQAGAGRDNDGHAGDHREGGEQAASDAPAGPQKSY